MNRRHYALLLATTLAAGLTAGGLVLAASRGRAPAPKPPAAADPGRVDADYVLALSAANRFLDAWRTRDFDRGLPLASPVLLKAEGKDGLTYWLNGGSNPHHEAFEVGPGRRVDDR